MKIITLLNRDSGTLKTTDLAWLSDLITSEFMIHGHGVEVRLVGGKDLIAEIGEAARRQDLDVLLVAGGDGTVSAAAGAVMGSGVALGIIPAGTMNLFARTLQIPLDLQAAVAALAGGTLTSVDIATANGVPFVHQYAVGLHAKIVRLRNRIRYGSRIGKVIASWQAILTALRRLTSVELEVEIDGVVRRIETPALAISNNLYGDGHLPYADDPQGGALGVYICQTRDIKAVTRLAGDIVLGTWRRNRSLAVYSAASIRITYAGKNRHNRSVRDGELADLDAVTDVVVHPGALRILAPAEAGYLKS